MLGSAIAAAWFWSGDPPAGKSADRPVLKAPVRPTAANPRLPAPTPQAPAATSPPPTHNPRATALALQVLPQPLPGTFSAQFFFWLRDYLVAAPADRPALLAEGQRLAAARRTEYKQLIAADPRRALEEAVPMVARQQLPAEIVAQLEERLSGVGRFEVQAISPDSDPAEPTVRRFATLAGREWRAYVYGRRERQMSQEKAMLNGVGVDQQMALSESPVRPLETGEIPDATKQAVEKCPVSGLSTAVERKADEELPPITPETPAVEAGEQIIYLCDGGHIHQLVEEILSQEGATGGPTAATSSLPITRLNSTGVRRYIYMRVVFPDRLQEPQTERDAWTNCRQLDEYFKENSYGRLSFQGAVTPVLLLPRSEAWYKTDYTTTGSNGPIMTDAKEAARAAGYPPEDYHHFVILYSGGPGSFGGLGSVNGSNTWLKSTAIGTFRHEIGHNIGVWHSNFWNTGGTSTIGPGANAEYGHHNDVMGSSGSGGHFNASMKEQLQWITPETYHTAAQSGVYRIFQFDQVNQDPARRFAIKVAKDADRDYWIEFRQKLTTNPWYTNGASINWSPWGGGGGGNNSTNAGSNNGTQLLDMTPGSPDDKNDSPLVIGRTFSDPSADLHITPIGKGATTPESLDVVVHVGTAAGNSPPTLAVTPSATNIAAGGAITFTATATDPNGDTLAYAWTFGDKLSSFNGPSFSTDNAAVQTKTFTTTGWYAVQCTASDMKGGIARKTVLVQVGTPTTFSVSGTVTDGASAPVFDARVHNGQTGANFRGAYTDSDGSYVITNLAAGSVTLSTTQAGSTFAPSFSNPVTVGPSQTGLDFTASDTARVALTALDDTAAEGGDTAVFRLSRTGATTNALVVHVDFSGSASTGDYALNPVANTATAPPLEVFTIPAGASEMDITLTPNQDTTQEGPEQLIVSLINAGNTYLPTGAQTVTLTIDDDDTTKPRVALTLVDSEATEGGDAAQFLVSRTGDTAAALTVNFTVDTAVLANAVAPFATNGTDYNSIGASAIIPAGASSVLIPITPVNDALVEGMELVKITLASNANYILSTATTATAKLNDDDIATVTVAATDATANENGDPGTFTIARTGDTGAALAVSYSMTGDALHGTDYQALSGFVTIPAGQASAQIPVIPIQDTHGEPLQSVVLQIRSAPHFRLAAPSSATITLTDDGDLPVVAVNVIDGVVEEKASPDPGSFRITTTGTGSGNITVSYQITGTATSGVDFTALSGTLSIAKNAISNLTIAPLNDSLPEDVETVTLTLLPSASYQVDLQNSATMAIRDDDAVNMVSVSPNVTSFTEGGTGRFYFSRSGSTAGALDIPYSVGGTADGADFTALSGIATIPAAATGVYVDVVTTNDSVAEGVETIEVTIAPDTDTPRTYGIEIGQATLPLLDNDSGFTNTVAFAQSSTTATESGGTVSIAVNRTGSGVASSTCSVAYSVRYATATGGGVDFLLPAGRLDFAPGETVKNIPLELIDDVLPEGIEGVVLQLLQPSGAQIGSNGGRSAVLILDNEPRILIEALDPFATEGGDTAQFRITRRGHTVGALSVPVSVSGTATSGSDFTALPAGVTIPSGQASATFNLTALADAANEGPETVTVTLAPSGTSLPGNQSSATIRIADAQSDDPPFLHLVSPRGTAPGIPADAALHLDALATDDTPASLTTAWSKVTGPGTVTFDDATAPATRARFSASGAYTLRLTASDGTQTSTLDVAITAGAGIVPWTNTNIGTVTYAGAATEQNGQVALSAAGSAPTGTTDSLFLRSRQLTGNGEIVARVQHLVNTSTSARLGVMVRESTSNNARMAAMFLAPSASFSSVSNLTSFNYRPTNTVGTVTTAGIAPAWWVRVTRSGDVFTAYDSPDGATWTQRGAPQTLAMTADTRIGLAFSSANTTELSLGIVDNVRVTGAIENNGPLVEAGTNSSVATGVALALAGSITDDGLPGDPGSVQASWSLVSGPGTATFAEASAAATTVTLSTPGTYVLRLTANDGEVSTSDDVTITATAPVVSVIATTPTATEAGLTPGQFTVTRTGTSGALTIHFTIAGSAGESIDFASIGTQITIADGSASALIAITPLADTLAEGPEAVSLSLTTDAAYTLGVPATAEVTLADLPIDQWRFDQFGAEANNPLLADLHANPDADTLDNLLEYAFGTSPLTNNASPVVSDTVTIGPDRFLRLTVPKNPAASGVLYEVQANSNLALPLSWSVGGLIIELNDANTLRVRDSVPLGAPGQRFLRVFVNQP
jgi:hypothetical protein